MSIRSVEQGIAAIQAGNVEEGARMLRIALKTPDLSGAMRAIACLWLAEINPDSAAKRNYYNDALSADPHNPQIRQRVEAWFATQLVLPPVPPQSTPSIPMPPVPPGATPTSPQPAIPPQPASLPGTGSLNRAGQDQGGGPSAYNVPPASRPGTGALRQPVVSGAYTIVGVFGGPNGPGTAFAVNPNGLLATTRFVVGGTELVTIELEIGRQIEGHVVRAYPQLDVAFIQVEAVIDMLLVTPLPRIPDDMPLLVIPYNGQTLRGRRRSTKRQIAPNWFPTDIAALPDAGGGAVLDERQYLIGMMTRNTNSTSNLAYGIHINAIRKLADQFKQETSNVVYKYCPYCGYASKAGANGGYYCEICGSILPEADHIARSYQSSNRSFYQVHDRACMYCNATVGFHNEACLRCGRKPEIKSPR